MQIVFALGGGIRCIYGESIDLNSLGRISIARGSHVEPDELGQWFADLAPVGGPKLGPFARRTDALTAEVAWLEKHWLSDSES